LAYRANFFISLLHSLLNLGSGVLGLVVAASALLRTGLRRYASASS
jgi:ABC-type uncharacterized transport system permease subunit